MEVANKSTKITNENFRESKDVVSKRKFILKHITKNPLSQYQLAKLTGWGFWGGAEWVVIDYTIANKILKKLRAELKETNHNFLNEFADFIRL